MNWSGDILKARCVDRSISVAELARQMGVSRPTVYGWLAGKAPRKDRLARLGEIFQIDPAVFYGIAPSVAKVRPSAPTGTRGKLFKRTGVRLVYALLTDPRLDKNFENDLLNVPVRELASKAGVSIGSVSELLSEMKERGFLLEDGRTKQLVNRKVLFDQWLHGYMETRFRVKKQCFEAKTIQWWKNRRPEEEGFLWGGEPAAARLTDDFLRPGKLTLYTDQPLYDLVVDGDLHQVPSGGNVEFVQPLLKSAGENGCVHPLLVYADLICSSDDRNTETATRIYDRYLRHIIEAA